MVFRIALRTDPNELSPRSKESLILSSHNLISSSDISFFCSLVNGSYPFAVSALYNSFISFMRELYSVKNFLIVLYTASVSLDTENVIGSPAFVSPVNSILNPFTETVEDDDVIFAPFRRISLSDAFTKPISSGRLPSAFPFTVTLPASSTLISANPMPAKAEPFKAYVRSVTDA